MKIKVIIKITKRTLLESRYERRRCRGLCCCCWFVLCCDHSLQQKQVPHDDSTTFPLLLLLFNARPFVLLLLIWFLFTGIEIRSRCGCFRLVCKTYKSAAVFLIVVVAAAEKSAAASLISVFSFQFSSSFLQLLHTTLISTQRCTNTHNHTHTHAYTRSY